MKLYPFMGLQILNFLKNNINIYWIIILIIIKFELRHLLPLVSKTKMADVSKLISVGNLLVRKVTWLVLTTMSTTLILSRAFGADCMTRIAYIYSCLPSTHSLTFFTYRDSTLSLSHFDFQQSTPWKCIHSATFFFLVLPFRLDLLQPRTQPQKFCQTPKETNNQHGRRHMPSRTRCYISIYQYLTWNT